MSELIAQTWVFIGKRFNGGKLFDGWLTINDGVLGTTPLYYKAGRSRNVIGGIYSVNATADGSKANVSSAKFTGASYGKEEVALQWRTEHDAAMTQKRIANNERMAKDDELAALAPLRKRYMGADSTTRTLIELQLLHYLRMTRISS